MKLNKWYWIMLGTIFIGGFLLMMFWDIPDPVEPQLPYGAQFVPSDTTIVNGATVITYKIVDDAGVRP